MSVIIVLPSLGSGRIMCKSVARARLPIVPPSLVSLTGFAMKRSVRVSIVVVFALAVGGCGDDVIVPNTSVSSEMAAAPPMMARQSRDAVATLSGAGGGAQPAAPGDASASAVAPSSMIIRNGTASVLVDSLELAVAAVQQMASRLGGYIGNTSMASGEYQVRSATIELKIPAARFDSAVAGLEPLGVVESVSSTAEDVGEEFVDVTARVANAKRLEERLVVLLATRAGKLEDVLAVERELARVREEIERYEGRLRYLKSRVDVSTLTVTVHERAPLVSQTPGNNVIVDAFKQAWRNFVHFIAGFISMLGVIVPSAALLIVLAVGYRRWRRPKSP